MTETSAITEWKRLVPLPKTLNVVAVHIGPSGTYCILEDGRMYEKVLDEWQACMPPLTPEQRTPR